MSITQKLDALVPLIAQKLNDLNGYIGDLSTLNTTDQASLVNAVNEILTSAVQIDDTGTSTSSVWSSNKTSTEITAAVAAALEGEDLSDIAAQIVALMQADNGLLSFEAAQTLTPAQQTQGLSNLGAGSAADVAANASDIGDAAAFDPVAAFNAAVNF